MAWCGHPQDGPLHVRVYALADRGLQVPGSVWDYGAWRAAHLDAFVRMCADFCTAMGIAFEARINPFTDNLLRNLPPPGYFDSEEGQAFINQHS